MPVKNKHDPERISRLRKELADKEKRKQAFGGNAGGGFPFWSLPYGGSAKIRFLPDADESNPMLFLKKKEVIKLKFPSIKGVANEKGLDIEVQVPTLSAWGEKCFMMEYAVSKFKESKEKDKDKEIWNEGRRFYVSRSGLAQCFVRDPGMDEKDVPENPIRKLYFNKQLYQHIEAQLQDFVLDEQSASPDDYERGTDFNIRKTQNGDFANYQTSSFDRRETPLTDEELKYLEKYELWNLSDLCPAYPDKKQQEIIFEMYEASKANEPYDPDRWAPFYRPHGVKAPEDGVYKPEKYAKEEPEPGSKAPAKKAEPETTVADVEKQVEKVKTSDSKTDKEMENVNNIINQIKEGK